MADSISIVHAGKVLSRHPKSSVWKVFGFIRRSDGSIDKSQAVCRICHARIKYVTGSNTTNFHTHIKHHEYTGTYFDADWGEDTTELVLYPEDAVSIEAQQLSIEATMSNDMNSNGGYGGDDVLRCIHESVSGAQSQKNIHLRVAEYLISNLETLNVLNDNTFTALLLDNCEKLSQDYYRFVLFPRLYKETKAKLCIILKTSLSVSLSTSCWISKLNGVQYLSVFAHVLSKSWRNSSLVIGTVSCKETTNGLFHFQLENMLKEYTIDSREDLFSCITWDGSSNEQLHVGNFVAKHIRCLGMEIDFIMQKLLKIESLEQLTYTCRNLLKTLKEHDGDVPIKDDSKTIPLETFLNDSEHWDHWTSFYEVLNKANNIFTNICIKSLSDVGKNCLLTVPSEVKDFICRWLQFLRPIYNATLILKDQTSLSMVLPIIKKLNTSLQPFMKEETNTFPEKLVFQLLNHLADVFQKETQTSDILLVSSLMDPRYKDLMFVEKEQHSRARMLLAEEATNVFLHSSHFKKDKLLFANTQNSKAEKDEVVAKKPKIDDDWLLDVTVVPSEPETEVNNVEENIDNEIDRYMAMEQIKSSPTTWWKHRGLVFPILIKVAEKYLSIQATCMAYQEKLEVEEATKIKFFKRSLLQEDMVDSMVFLNDTYSRIKDQA